MNNLLTHVDDLTFSKGFESSSVKSDVNCDYTDVHVAGFLILGYEEKSQRLLCGQETSARIKALILFSIVFLKTV